MCAYLSFILKIKFKKLVHVVGFIIRIYHDARPPERQNPELTFQCHANTSDFVNIQ